MTVGSGNGPPNRRGPSLSSGMMIDAVRGVPRVRAWPAKRGTPKSPKQREAVDNFRRAQRLAKSQAPSIQVEMAEVTRGTPFMPRDLQTMAMFGRLLQIDLENGYSLRSTAMIDDVSTALDLISNQPGAKLVRGPERWEAYTGGETYASWVSCLASPVVSDNTSTSPSAWKGNVFRCEQGSTVFAACARATWYAGGSYRMFLARLNETGHIDQLSLSPEWVPDRDGRFPHVFGCGLDLIEGREYAVMVGRTDQGGSYAMPLQFNTEGGWPVGLTLIEGARWTHGIPEIGDLFDNPVTSLNTPPILLRLAT